MLKLLAEIEHDTAEPCCSIVDFIFRWAEQDSHPVGIVAEFWSRFHTARSELKERSGPSEFAQHDGAQQHA